MKTFLFYDIETSGLNPVFDQVLTFASIRTDLTLREIERDSITIKLRRDVIPSPRAFLTHGLTLEQLDKGVCEYAAAKKIHALFNTPGTISLGYNSLGFDDEFLRFLFYRNLLDPYTHQYNNGCSRMDMLPLAVIYRNFYPGDLIWPRVDGKPSLRLECISRENKFAVSGKAHEAMSDVEALVELSRVFRKNEKIWAYALDFFDKVKDGARISRIKKTLKVADQFFRTGLILSPAFGAQQNYMAPVIHLGGSKAYKNQSLWLRTDSDDVLGIKEDADVSQIYVIRKHEADAYIVLPVLERFLEKLPDPIRLAADKNADDIQKHSKKFMDLVSYHINYKYPVIPDLDLDAALYQDGFFSYEEKADCRLFHQAPDGDKRLAFDQLKSPRIRRIASRIMSRNFSDMVPAQMASRFKAYLERLTTDSSGEGALVIGFKNDEKRTCEKALAQIADIKKDIEGEKNSRDIHTLDWLDRYIRSL